jgi:hypothetical protein
MNAACVSRGSLRFAEVTPRRSRRSTLVRRAALALATAAPATLALAAPASAATETFNYTGAAQTWTVPAGVTEANFDLYGASGGETKISMFSPRASAAERRRRSRSLLAPRSR